MSTPESSLFGDAAAAGPAAGGEYRVLARKYRPRDFTDLIGQGPMVRTLTNAFETGRIAQAYMLTGVRGVGKTTTARILARALNYETETVHQPTIDLAVPGIHCQAIIEGRHVDVIEMDAASHTGIDDIREIIEQVRYRPVSARYKVYIIDEVHMLSTQAFNGLLKTLEEPPPHVKFIFATTEIRKVPITVLSRCQRFDLRRIDAGLLVHHFGNIAHAENVPAEDEALAMIARASEGSARDGLSLMDQAIAHGAGHIETAAVRTMLGLADRGRIVDLFDHVVRGQVAAALEEFAAQYEGGANPPIVLTDLADFTHLVTRLKFVPEAGRDASLSETERLRGADFAAFLSVSTLSRLWQMLLKGIPEVETSMRPYAAAEMVLIRLTHAASLPSPEEAVRRLSELAQEAGGEAAPARSAPAAAGPTHARLASPLAPGAPVAVSPAMPSPEAPAAPRPAAGPDMDRPTQAPGQRQAGGAMRRAEPQREGAAQPDPVALPDAVAPGVSVGSLDELVALAAQHRDIKMKTLIRTCLRLVRLEPGRIEANLTPDTPKSFVGDLMGALEKWTGRRWMVSVSSEQGAPTLAQAEAARRDGLVRDAREDPDVAAILKRFPGARITDVRIESDPAQDDLAEGGGDTFIPVETGDPDTDGDTLDD